MRPRNGKRVIGISLVILAVTMVVACGIGPVRIPSLDVLQILIGKLPGVSLHGSWSDTAEMIVWSIRLPRILLAVLTGMSLSLAGAAYQGLFKNPLADPYVLGVSAGGALGGAVAVALLEGFALQSVAPVPAFAFLGGLAAAVLVYRLAAVGNRVSVTGLLLAGAAVSSLCMALVSLILFLTKPYARDTILFWMMGGLGNANWTKVGWMAPYLAAGLAVLLYFGRDLNAMLLGEESAFHLGVPVERVKRVVLVAGALLTASSVAFCGAIGFVGLIVPHVVRFLVGPDHRYLLPATGVVGAIVLVVADTFARTATGATEIPVGLVMALLGGPFFLWLLRSRLTSS